MLKRILFAVCFLAGAGACGDRGDCPLSECVCLDRAGFPEGAGAEGDGADAVRAALFGRATRLSGALRRTWNCRSDQIPHRGRPHLLILIAFPPFRNCF